MSASQSGVQPAGVQDLNTKTVTWKLVLARTYELYAARFWTYFRIAIVPAVIAYVISYLWRIVIRQLVRADFFPPFSGKWLAMVTALEWTRGAIYWTISAFFLAAIAATFARDALKGPPAAADAYTLLRMRMGAVAAVAVMIWTMFYIGRTASSFAVLQLLNALHIGLQNFWVTTGAFAIPILLLAGLLSKFGLAIPELMHNSSSSIRNALKKSMKETAGWEVFFMVFLVKSAAIGYGIYWIAGQGLDWLWQHWTLNPNRFSWVEWSVYIIAAVVETPLFIAFSVLYMELQERRKPMTLLPPTNSHRL